MKLFEDIISENCEIRLSQTFFFKNLTDFSQSKEKINYCSKYFLLKLCWESKNLLQVKFAFRNIDYKESKYNLIFIKKIFIFFHFFLRLLVKEFKKYIDQRAFKEITLINISNQFLKFIEIDKSINNFSQ